MSRYIMTNEKGKKELDSLNYSLIRVQENADGEKTYIYRNKKEDSKRVFSEKENMCFTNMLIV